MKNKIIITALFIVFTLCAQAQDKYQFMIIEYRSMTTTLFVSIDGTTFTKENIELPKEEKDWFNSNPLLKKVKEYQENGWEVMSFNNIQTGAVAMSAPSNVYTSYLRKKIETR